MDIKVSRPDILPEGFVGHIVFREDGPTVLGICYEHKLFVVSRSWSEAFRKMPVALKLFLEERSTSIPEEALVRPVIPAWKREMSRSRPIDVYRIKGPNQVRTSGPWKGPVYIVGTLATRSESKATQVAA